MKKVKTTLFAWLAMFAGMDMRKVHIRETGILSITGNYKLLGYMLKLALYAGILGYEQIVKFGIREDGANVHLVLTERRTATVVKELSHKLPAIAGYTYMHAISAMQSGVNVALFDHGFKPDTQNGKAYGQFAAAVFDNGKVRGGDTNTLLLLGTDTEDRVLCAAQWCEQNPLTVVNQKIRGDVRFSFVQDATILAAQYGTGQVAALHVDRIKEMFQSAKFPVWQTALVEGLRIEDITTSINDQPTVAITVKNNSEQRKLVLAHIGWVDATKPGLKNPAFKLVIDPQYAIPISQSIGSIVRLSARTAIAIDNNGSNAPLLAVIDLADDNRDLQRIARAATPEAYEEAFAQAA